MNDEIIPVEFNSTEPPAVTEELPADSMPPAIAELRDWSTLSLDEKVDILHHKMDSVAAQVAWIGQTFQGVINTVGKISPIDIFKMMKGGK